MKMKKIPVALALAGSVWLAAAVSPAAAAPCLIVTLTGTGSVVVGGDAGNVRT